jgi:hypothetical protein
LSFSINSSPEGQGVICHAVFIFMLPVYRIRLPPFDPCIELRFPALPERCHAFAR